MEVSNWIKTNRRYLINMGIILCIASIFYNLIQNHTNKAGYSAEIPIPQHGQLNLNSWDFKKNGTLKLNEGWAFYHKQLLTSNDFKKDSIEPSAYVPVEEAWNDITIDGKQLSPNGYGTYRLVLEHNADIPQLALAVYSFHSSSKIFINGILTRQNGEVGTTDETSRPYYLPRTIVINTEGKSHTEIIIQVANFYGAKGGGNRPLYIGIARDLLKEMNQRNNATGISVGGLLVVGFFFLGMYLFWRDNKSVLYFSLFCLNFGYWLSSSFHYLILTLFPELPFEFVRTAEYVSLYGLVYFCFAFYTATFPDKLSNATLKILKYISIAFVAIALFTPHVVTSTILKYHNLITVLMLVYLLVKGTVVIIRNKPYSGFMFAGGTILFTSGLYKMGTYWKWFEDVPLFYETILILYILSQGLILAHKIALAFKQEELLKEQNHSQAMELATQAEELSLTNDLLNEQKANLENINFKITANINAASSIQKAMLPSIKTLKQVIDDTFVIWKPRDTVGGDFYWFKEVKGKTIIAAIDCTGHGVSGALMSMSAAHILKDITGEMKIYSPEKILQAMNRELIAQFSHDTINRQASMDASICMVDHTEEKLYFAGAKNPLIYIQNSELHYLKGDRISLGNGFDLDTSFNLHTIEINTPTTFYIFSDGYQDQFGGPEDKKFGIKKMKQYLLNLHQLPMEKQKEEIEKLFEKWKGHGKQIDDIMIIGNKVIPKNWSEYSI